MCCRNALAIHTAGRQTNVKSLIVDILLADFYNLYKTATRTAGLQNRLVSCPDHCDNMYNQGKRSCTGKKVTLSCHSRIYSKNQKLRIKSKN